jgi:hypothetical protein
VRERGKRRFDLGRLSRGEAIAAASALALFVFMFFDWYGVEAVHVDLGRLDLSEGGGAWHSLEVVPWLLVLAILAVLGSALLRLRRPEWQPAIPLVAAVAVLGGASFLLILLRILFPPNFDSGGIPIVVSVEAGAYLALAAAAGIAYGGYRAMGERGTSFAKVADALSKPGAKPRRRPGPAPRSPAKRPSKTRSRSSSG